jgi:hypothetical protein
LYKNSPNDLITGSLRGRRFLRAAKIREAKEKTACHITGNFEVFYHKDTLHFFLE